jgi:hypothetical protein
VILWWNSKVGCRESKGIAGIDTMVYADTDHSDGDAKSLVGDLSEKSTYLWSGYAWSVGTRLAHGEAVGCCMSSVRPSEVEVL